MLFCTDLDGTLYSDDKTVSRENLDAIEYFKSEGGLFTFITGRVPQTATGICDIVKPNAPYGCINGGGIYDPQENKYLWSLTLGRETLELVRTVDEQLPEVGIQLNTKETIYFNKDNSAMVRFRELTGLPNIYRHYADVSEEILKVVFAHEDCKQIALLRELLYNHPMADSFDFIQSEKTLYEILPKGASKGAVLLKLSEILNIEVKNTVTVGDYYNDVSMLRAAGMGFAVANALEDVKRCANYVTVSNNNHAIAAIVDGLDRGKFV